MDFSASALAIIGCAFLLAGAVKGVLGMGLPTVAMAILSLVMPVAQAASVLVIPSLVTNAWQFAASPHRRRVLKRFGWMMAAICLGTFLGITLLTGSSKAASATLGIVLALYGASGLAALHFTVSPRQEPWLSPLIGLVTGVLTGATGVFVIPAVPYLASLDLDKDALIQTLGLSFTVSTMALGVGLLYTGHFQASVGTVSLLALAPALAGMFAGQRLRALLRPEVFRRWFFVALVAVGVFMAARALA